MRQPDERIELLMNRRLDGELSVADERELETALAASPELRSMMDQMCRLDGMCAAVIEAESRNDTSVESVEWAPVSIASQRSNMFGWVRFLSPMAAAACVAWLVWIGTEPRPKAHIAAVPPVGTPYAGHQAIPLHDSTGRNGGKGHVRTVSDTGGRMDGRRDVRAYPVVGDDGNVYLIELDRTKTYRRTAQRPMAGKAFGEF